MILSFVLIGGFQILNKLYVRNFIAKKTAEFELQSQQTLDQVAQFLYYRVPLSTIGYDPVNHDFKYIGEINDNNYSVLEWIGYLNDAMVERNLSGFVDLYASDKNNRILVAKDFNKNFINDILQNKYKLSKNIEDLTAIIFAGSFDRGEEGALDNYNNSFGWHGNEHNYVFTIKNISDAGNNDCNLTLDENITGKRIYEKFYLVDSAYAIALYKDIKNSWHCSDLDSNKLNDDDLLLFYNYRPWLGKTFCADNSGSHEGNVTLLAQNVTAFRVRKINSHLVLKITMNKQKADINITVSKQKVAF